MSNPDSAKHLSIRNTYALSNVCNVISDVRVVDIIREMTFRDIRQLQCGAEAFKNKREWNEKSIVKYLFILVSHQTPFRSWFQCQQVQTEFPSHDDIELTS